MQSLKSEFLKEMGKEKEVNKIEQNIKNACYTITKQKISRLKNDESKKQRVAELIKNYIKILESEGIENISTISSVIDGTMEALSREKELDIYKKISMVTKLKQEIEAQKEDLKNTLQDIYENIEKFSKNFNEKTSNYLEMAIKDTKLKEVLLLGILKETTEEAIITTIENRKNIEEVTEIIIQNIIFQSIGGDDFSKEKTLEAAKTVLDVAVGIADEYQAFAKEILKGTTKGIKIGIANAINDFNNNLEFLPDEIRSQREEKILFEGLNIIDLNSDFVDLIKTASNQSNGISKQILEEIVSELDNSMTRLMKITTDTKETILKKVEKLKESPKVNELRKSLANKLSELKIDEKIKNIKKEDIENVAKESKKLGLRAWEVAKSAIDNAIKSTKDSVNKGKKQDKDKE
jgi:hypothetical protein